MITGLMGWITFVDGRVFRALAKEGDGKTITKIFEKWWPAGKGLMMPMLTLGVGAQGWAWWEGRKETRRWLYALSGVCLGGIGVWTGAVMKGDINKLMYGVRTEAVVNSFFKLHNVRLGFATIASVSSLWAYQQN